VIVPPAARSGAAIERIAGTLTNFATVAAV
jgi:hypothetical protein